MTAAAHLDIDPRGLATLTLNRPDVHNAFDDQLIARLIDLIHEARDDKRTRVLLLASTGKSFSAGADLAWMRRMADASREDNLHDARKLALLMETLNSFPAPTVAKVQGAVMGGGVGLVSCCDIVIASEAAFFALSEVKLGLAPAAISPYVIAKMGVSQARRFFVSGERFSAIRAAAIGQLAVWADRIGVPIVKGPEGGDPAAIVFDAVKAASERGTDALIVDTAGRLQNKRELMDELAKIHRVLGRLNPAAPHDVVLVLDATNGQNALAQIETFKEVAGVTGLVMTKLDGTARGGVLVAAAEQYGLPIHAIGVGERIDDLRPFDPDLVARVIAGVAA